MIAWDAWTRIAFAQGLIVFAVVGTIAGADVVLAQPLASRPSLDSPGLKPLTPPLLPSAQSPLPLFRDPPTLTSRYGFHDNTVLPFIGLGFRGGETWDVTRQALRHSQLETPAAFADLFDQHLLPNEFQAGVRIPF